MGMWKFPWLLSLTIKQEKLRSQSAKCKCKGIEFENFETLRDDYQTAFRQKLMHGISELGDYFSLTEIYTMLRTSS